MQKYRINGKEVIFMKVSFMNRTEETPFYHTQIDGMIFPLMISDEKKLSVLVNQIETKPNDVFLVSYPRSGTHLLAHIVNHIVKPSPLNDEKYVTLIGNIPYLEGTDAKNLALLASPRYMITHLPSQFIPSGNTKYIVIIRDPRDVAVSTFHFLSSIERVHYNGNWEEFLNLFMEGKTWYGSYLEHILGWWQRCEKDNILFLRYEDFTCDLVEQITVISKFLIYHLYREEILDIAEKCTFQAMKKSGGSWLESEKLMRQGTSVYRKGIVGDWKNYFSDEQLEIFSKWYRTYALTASISYESI